jgi:hypothetical protein
MKFIKNTIDNIGLMDYSEFTMQDLKQLIQEIDDQMTSLQSKRNVLLQAMEIEKELKSGAPMSVIPDGALRRRDVFPEPEEIEKAILTLKGEFKSEDAAYAVKEMFPEKKKSPKTSISTVLYQLIQSKKLKYVRERQGRRGAVYVKA